MSELKAKLTALEAELTAVRTAQHARESRVRSDVRRAAKVESYLEAALGNIEAALDVDEDLLRMLGLWDLLQRVKRGLFAEMYEGKTESAIYRVRRYLASLDATSDRPVAAHPTPEVPA